jgi:hypothetical protein
VRSGIRARMLGFMTSAGATVLAAVISAAAVIVSIVVSIFVARASATSTVKTKLDELRQTQITDIIRQRIERYPSLWSFCQESITLPIISHTEVKDGWASTLSKELETWHTKNGIFLSQSSYLALYYLRKKAREFAKTADSGTHAEGSLQELAKIWSESFTDEDNRPHINLSASMKNDLGSYAQVALSQ